MSKPKFRKPNEMESDEKREPVSVRVKITTKNRLDKAAKTHGLSLAILVSNILDDYVKWLDSQPTGDKR